MNPLEVFPHLWISVLVVLLSLQAGCVANSADSLMADARRFSAVTRVDPNFRPDAGANLIWFSDLIVQDENSAVKATADQIALITQTIESQFIRKRYQFTNDIEQADYMVAAAVIMDDSPESQQITELVQIFPGLAGAVNDLDQGTLLVVISPPTDPRTAPLLWRGAIQVFLVSEALSPEMRNSRLQSFTARLIAAVPEAGTRD